MRIVMNRAGMNKAVAGLAAVTLSGLVLAGCGSKIKAPMDTGKCYTVVPAKDGKSAPRYNLLAENQPQIEFCAARLEEVRLRFLRLGGNHREMIGAYQGQFIFIDARGVSIARTWEGVRFFALARTGDGRLAIPGAIQRDIDSAGKPEEVPAPPPIAAK